MPNLIRFEAARVAGLQFVGFISGLAMFEGTPEQFKVFHEYLGTPSLV